MSEAWRVAGRNAIAIAVVALIAATFRLPQPFLAVLVAFLLVGESSLSHARILHRIAGAWIGVISGMILLIAFPQQPWLLLPSFALFVSVLLYHASRTGNHSITLVTIIGATAGVPVAVLDPVWAPNAALYHGVNATLGILCAALAFLVLPSRETAVNPTVATFPFRNAFGVGLTAATTLVVVSLFTSLSPVITVIAATLMAFNLFVPGGLLLLKHRTAGAFIGILLSLFLDICVSGSGNNIAVFIVTFSVLAALLAWIGTAHTALRACCTQAASMFVVAAPLIPMPDRSLLPMFDRCLDVLLGCLLAALLHQANARMLQAETLRPPKAIAPPPKSERQSSV